jgi:hypothetical protein
MRFLAFLFMMPTWGEKIHDEFDQFLLDNFS